MTLAEPKGISDTSRRMGMGTRLLRARAWARIPWWVTPVLVFVAFRGINVAMIFVALPAQVRTGSEIGVFRTAAGSPAPGLETFATNWDGQWYWEIATQGYPTTLPRGADGAVSQNAWAFFPGFPMLIRAISSLFGSGFPVTALVFNVILGAVASSLVYAMARNHTNVSPLKTCILFNAFVCAPVFLMAYSDPLALVITIMVLMLVERRRLWWTLPLLMVLSVTRAVLPAFTIFFLFWFIRFWRHEGWGSLTRASLALTCVSGLLSFGWPAIAALATGDPFAFWKTQAAWARDVGLLPPLQALGGLTGHGLSPAIAVPLVIALPALVLTTVAIKSPNLILRSWSLSYTIFLLALVTWNGTILRYFLLAIPVYWPIAERDIEPAKASFSRKAMFGVTILALLALQWGWIRYSATVSDRSLFPP